MPYQSNHPLEGPNSAITRVVIVNHGSSRNCVPYFGYVDESLTAIGKQSEILVVSVQWLRESGLNDEPDLLFFAKTWRQGNLSLSTSKHPRPALISNFAVVDDLLEDLTDGRFPNLNTIVYTGHSAGGQMVDRYAPGSTADLGLGNITFIYVPANPSSWVYLNGDRVIDGTEDQFAIPDPADQCDGEYNWYKYGLENLNVYMGDTGVATIRSNFENDIVVYLLGSQDTGSQGLDTTCEAKLQGANRIKRGTIYFNYVQHFYGPSILDKHEKIVVSGVGHSGEDMYNSPEGRRVLFGCNANGTCEPPNVIVGETQATCPEDCGGGPVCGDETCDPGEDQCNCPEDCGTPPGTETSCTDGIDNDCDSYTDCDDGDCNGDPACPFCGDLTCDPGEDQCNCPGDCGTPPGTETSCTDGVDNDCDNDTDCDDADCTDDPACICLPKGASCTEDIECCSNKCRGGAGNKTCK